MHFGFLHNFLFSLSLSLPLSDSDPFLSTDLYKKDDPKRLRTRTSYNKIYVNGYRFVVASQSNTTIYLKCANFRSQCKARASKRKSTHEVIVTKGVHSISCMPDPYNEQDNGVDIKSELINC